MFRRPTTPRQWLTQIASIIMLLSLITLVAAGLWIGWSSMLVSDLPFAFWTLYALLVISFVVILFMSFDTTTKPSPKSQIPMTIGKVVLGLLIIASATTTRHWEGSTLIETAIGATILLFGISNLLSYLLSQTNSNPPQRKRNN